MGPWAAATVTIYRRGTKQVEQSEEDTFVRVHGSWVDAASPSVADLNIPSSDERNLDLTSSSSSTSPYVVIYLLACWFFGLAGIWDVLLQPRRTFGAVERSKLKWLGIEGVGAPLTGIFTWAYYAIRIRPALVKAGGRRARTGLTAFLVGLGEMFEGGGGAGRPVEHTQRRLLRQSVAARSHRLPSRSQRRDRRRDRAVPKAAMAGA